MEERKLTKREKFEQKQKEKQKLFNEAFDQLENNLGANDNSEKNLIRAKLDKLNLELKVMPSDGDCLFSSIADQLEIHNLTSRIPKTYQCSDIPLNRSLRHMAASYMSENRSDFQIFSLKSDNINTMNDEEFDEYLKSIKHDHAWGGNLELKALCNLLDISILIVQSNMNDILIGEEGKPKLVITYHHNSFSQGNHYNSTCPKKSLDLS